MLKGRCALTARRERSEWVIGVGQRQRAAAATHWRWL